MPTLLEKGNIPNFPDQIPIYFIIDWFKNRINLTGIENRVLILQAETGSGKSTVLPAFAYQKIFKDIGERLICVTQPRVLTAIDIVYQIINIPHYQYFRLGKNIGYKTGPNKYVTSRGVLFTTVGSIALELNNLTDDQIIKTYGIFILDEVHEMSIELANLLLFLKNFMIRNKNNPRLPFIVCTSATFETDKFINYFSVDNIHNFIKVKGTSFPKYEHWLEHTAQNAIKDAAKLAANIHTNNIQDIPTQADILIFMPGAAQIDTAYELLNKLNHKFAHQNNGTFLLLKIDGLTVKDNKRDFQIMNIHPKQLSVTIDDKFYKPIRRIILATNVAETGLTLDYLKYVIDTGFSNTSEYYPIYDVSGLILKPINKNNAIQRFGRVGRKFPGNFYAMYTKNDFNHLNTIQLSDIIVSDISRYILSILHTNSLYSTLPINLKQIDYIDPIPIDSIHNSMIKLYALGFIHKDLTLSHFSDICKTMLPLEISRMIIASYSWKCCILDLITIAAYILLDLRKRKKLDWDLIYQTKGFNTIKARFLIADEFIDGLILFNSFTEVIKNNKLNIITSFNEYCNKIGISTNNALKFFEIRDDIIEKLITIGYDLEKTGICFNDISQDEFINYIVRLKYCIYEGYRLNILEYDSSIKKYKLRGLTVEIPYMVKEDEHSMQQDFKYSHYPDRLITNKISLDINFKTGIYNIQADLCSILDGFVQSDNMFMR